MHFHGRRHRLPSTPNATITTWKRSQKIPITHSHGRMWDLGKPIPMAVCGSAAESHPVVACEGTMASTAAVLALYVATRRRIDNYYINWLLK